MNHWSNRIRRYFEGTRHYSRRRFIIELALLPFPIRMVLGILWVLLGQDIKTTTEVVDKGDPIVLFATACLLAPALETLLGQWLPIWVASFFTRRLAILLTFSTIIFAAQHLYVGVSGFVMTLPPAVFLAWSFILKQERSRWEAYWVTTTIHSLHNFVALLLYYATKGVQV